MSKIKTKHHSDLYFLAGILLVIAFVIVRSFSLDVTHDEAYSFRISKNFWHVEALCTANTHWLNWAAIRGGVFFSLENNWQIRWLSLLSAFVFFALTYFFIKTLKHSYIKLIAFALLALNPFVLDYFVLARGYASGMALQALCLLFFCLYLAQKRKRFALVALFFSGLSAIANFNFFYFFSAFCLIYFYVCYIKDKVHFYKKPWFYAEALFMLAVTFLVLRIIWFIKTCTNDLGYGGDSFIEAIFCFSIDGLLYKNVNLSYNKLYISGIAFLLLTLVSLVYGLLLKKHKNQIYFYVSLLLIFMFGAVIFNNRVLGVVYPMYRTALMFFLPLSLIFICFLNQVFRETAIQKTTCIIVGFFLALNFILSLNFKTTFDFKEQSESKETLAYLESLNCKRAGVCPELFGVYINYYQLTEKYMYSYYGESINTYNPKGVCEQTNKLKEFDYLVLFPPYNISYYQNSLIKFKAHKLFPLTGALIVEVIK